METFFVSEAIASARSRRRFWWMACLVFSLLISSVPVTANDGDGYSVNPGDGLQISVWREEELNVEVLVTPDGNCTFPLIGQVKAAGRTVEEISVEIVERLGQFIPDPVVVVSVVDTSGNKVYVIGQVNKPGEYVMNPTLDVMQALSVAGGATPFAEKNGIKILRRTPNGQLALDFRYTDVIRGRNLQQNILLQSGDIVVVP